MHDTPIQKTVWNTKQKVQRVLYYQSFLWLRRVEKRVSMKFTKYCVEVGELANRSPKPVKAMVDEKSCDIEYGNKYRLRPWVIAGAVLEIYPHL